MDNKTKIMLLAVLLCLLIIAFLWSRIKYFRYKRRIARQAEIRKDKSRRRYVSAKMKERILERDDYTCQICGISRAYLDRLADGLGDYLLLEIDHIVPVSQGGSGADEDNLQVLCWRCNRKKGGDLTNKQVAAQIDYGARKLRRRRRLFF